MIGTSQEAPSEDQAQGNQYTFTLLYETRMPLAKYERHQLTSE